MTWSDANVIVSTLTKTVVLQGVQLNQPLSSLGVASAQGMDTADTLTTVSLRAVDAGGASTTPVSQQIVYDHYAAAPAVSLANDSKGELIGTTDDLLTRVAELKISGIEAGARIEYQLASAVAAPAGNWSDAMPEFLDGANTVRVRQIDAAGNVSDYQELTFTLDTQAPDLTFSLGTLEGASADAPGATSLSEADISVKYSGTLGAGEAIEWRVQGGEWQIVDSKAIDTEQHTVNFYNVDLSQADPTFELRAVDAAGNVGKTFSQLIDGPFGNAPTLSVQPSPEGLAVYASAAGKLYLTAADVDTPLLTTGGTNDAAAGSNTVGAQADVVTGTVKLVAADGQSATDTASPYIYTLGTNGNDKISATVAWGFDGDDVITGTSGDDVLIGGAGNDTITGGMGADQILVDAGHDTLIYAGGADSNLTSWSLAPGTSSLDMVSVLSGASVTFNVGIEVLNAQVSEASLPSTSDVGTVLEFLNTEYFKAAQSSTDAVLFAIGDDRSLLVVNDGNEVIDANDLAVFIIGSGTVSTDGFGNVVYGPAPDAGGIPGGGIPG